MDKQRDPAILRRKKRNRVILAAAAAVAIIALSVAVSRLQPALPAVDASTLWIRAVQRGPMVRDVRGAGTLVPEEIRWIPATTAGRVEKIVLRPGAQVKPDTIILELSNLDLQQSVRSAELDWKTALAQLANQKATLNNALLAQKASVVDDESGYKLSQTDLELNKSLADEGLVAGFTLKQKQVAVEQAKNRLDLARQQVAASETNMPDQLAPYEAAVNQRKADFDRLSQQLADLHVRATMAGLLQLVNVEVGQQVAPGANLARVSDPTPPQGRDPDSRRRRRPISPSACRPTSTRATATSRGTSRGSIRHRRAGRSAST